MKFKVTTWNEIARKVLILCDQIKKSRFEPDVLVFVLRGGAPVATMVSDCLGVREIAGVRARLYSSVGKAGDEVKIEQPLTIDIRDKRVLIVDDVADTGKTLDAIFKHLMEKKPKEIRVATIHFKPWSIFKPDYFVEETDYWIVYPWEYYEFIAEINRLLDKGELSSDDSVNAKKALEEVKKLLKELMY